MISKRIGAAGFYFLAGYFLTGGFSFVLGDAPQVFNDPALNQAIQNTKRRDSWGYFEFLHYHTEAAKQKEALEVSMTRFAQCWKKPGMV